MRHKILVVLSLCLLLAVVAPAQNGRRPMQNGTPPTPPDPQQMLQRQIDRLSNLLTLTDAQKAQAATILGNAEQSIQPLRQQMGDAHKSLAQAVKTNDVAQIEQLSTTIGLLTGQTTSIESKAQAAFFAILTPDQQAKMPNGPLFGGPGMGPGRGPGMGPGMPGMGPGMGPRGAGLGPAGMRGPIKQ
jgi:Spy/CpxP family protein refolding chaperone